MIHTNDSSTETPAAPAPGLGIEGREVSVPIHFNLPQAVLIEHALRRDEGVLTDQGALAFRTGVYTGRSPKDRFIVKDQWSENLIDWGAVNQPIEPDRFDALESRVLRHLAGREVFVEDVFAGTDPQHRLPIRVVSEQAYHALFAHQLFVRPTAEERASHRPRFTILAAPHFRAEPARDGTRSEVFILINFSRGTILIGGTLYAGEIKKSIFGVMNTLLPQRGVFPMHCSANVGERGDVALFFGLSGTGKTTLSADPGRHLIGDDEHGWSDDGVFNFEGGCYAKCIRLNRLNEPEIYQAIRFGTVLENVVVDPITRAPDFTNASLTENTRAAYPIEFIPNFVPGGRGGHPEEIVFLTCDAFGVLPPVARLTPEQAMYHFLSGYTAKVAGTERGLGSGPEAVFSQCFGAPFMTLPPRRYADMLGERLRKYRSGAWLLNTGWIAGPFGVGRRIDLNHSRALVEAILSGKLHEATFRQDPVFGLDVPTNAPYVPKDILDPAALWSDPEAYRVQARALAARFRENFERFTPIAESIRSAGPIA